MSIELVGKIFENGEEIKAAELLVWLCLAERANKNTNECFPSIADTARRCRFHRRYVQEIIRALEKQGRIKTVFRQGHSAIYEVYAFTSQESPQGAHPSAPPLLEISRTPVHPFAHQGASPAHPRAPLAHQGAPVTVIEPSSEPCNEPEEDIIKRRPLTPSEMAHYKARNAWGPLVRLNAEHGLPNIGD